MCADSVVVFDVPFNGPSQMPHARDDRVIQAFPSDGADDTFHIRVLPRRGRRGQYSLADRPEKSNKIKADD